MSLSWPLATISPFALKASLLLERSDHPRESASTGDIRSALVCILPAARAVISVDALAPPQSTYLRKRVSHVRRHVVAFLGGEPSAFSLMSPSSWCNRSLNSLTQIWVRTFPLLSNAWRLLLQALPDQLHPKRPYPVCMTSVWSASGVIENRTAAAHDGQASATPPAEADSTGSDTSRAARSQPANVAPISYVLR